MGRSVHKYNSAHTWHRHHWFSGACEAVAAAFASAIKALSGCCGPSKVLDTVINGLPEKETMGISTWIQRGKGARRVGFKVESDFECNFRRDINRDGKQSIQWPQRDKNGTQLTVKPQQQVPIVRHDTIQQQRRTSTVPSPHLLGPTGSVMMNCTKAAQSRWFLRLLHKVPDVELPASHPFREHARHLMSSSLPHLDFKGPGSDVKALSLLNRRWIRGWRYIISVF